MDLATSFYLQRKKEEEHATFHLQSSSLKSHQRQQQNPAPSEPSSSSDNINMNVLPTSETGVAMHRNHIAQSSLFRHLSSGGQGGRAFSSTQPCQAVQGFAHALNSPATEMALQHDALPTTRKAVFKRMSRPAALEDSSKKNTKVLHESTQNMEAMFASIESNKRKSAAVRQQSPKRVCGALDNASLDGNNPLIRDDLSPSKENRQALIPLFKFPVIDQNPTESVVGMPSFLVLCPAAIYDFLLVTACFISVNERTHLLAPCYSSRHAFLNIRLSR